jgi:hypothetical protein
MPDSLASSTWLIPAASRASRRRLPKTSWASGSITTGGLRLGAGSEGGAGGRRAKGVRSIRKTHEWQIGPYSGKIGHPDRRRAPLGEDRADAWPVHADGPVENHAANARPCGTASILRILPFGCGTGRGSPRVAHRAEPSQPQVIGLVDADRPVVLKILAEESDEAGEVAP